MEAHGNEHGGHDGGQGVHLPDPSAWPFVAGIAAFIAGGALIWWTRDRDATIAGIALGFGIALLLISSAGWAYEDGRMKKKAEEGHGASPREPRFSQVLAFAIAGGRLDAARSASGVLTAVQRTDLRDIEGFEDLRVTVSPAGSGPSQVLVETTWKGRDGLHTYEGTRQTLLDILTGHEAQVVPGTVQTFDMEVVRDTKDTSFRFGLGAAATVIGGLAIAGFTIGAGLNLFASESEAAEVVNGGPVDPFAIRASDNRFNRATIEAAPAINITVAFENRGRAKHNIQFRTAKGGTELAPGATGPLLDGGGSESLTFTTPGPGTYFFECVVHPTEMVGEFIVKEGGPGGAPAAGATTPAAGTPAAK